MQKAHENNDSKWFPDCYGSFPDSLVGSRIRVPIDLEQEMIQVVEIRNKHPFPLKLRAQASWFTSQL